MREFLIVLLVMAATAGAVLFYYDVPHFDVHFYMMRNSARLATSFLQTNPNFSEAIKQPNAYPTPGFYPTSYSVRYDAMTQAYEISLDEFVLR